jgi:hypothetical protein
MYLLVAPSVESLCSVFRTHGYEEQTMQRQGLHPEYALKTYRYLRVGILSATSLLAASIVVDIVETGCALTSISAYYYSTVRSVFVGSLVAIGLALIVLKADRFEYLALNIAGFLAPLVALVPTRAFSSFGDCAIDDPLRLGDAALLGSFLDRSVTNNVWALMVAGLGGLLVTIYVYARGRRTRTRSLKDTLSGADTDERRTLIELAVFVGIAAVVGGWFLLGRRSFLDHAHDAAAISMFVALAAAAWISSRRTSRFTATYRAVAIGMVAVVPIVWLAGSSLAYRVFVIEALEIGLFGFYWAVQTIENWDEAVDVSEADPGAVIGTES